MENCKFYRLGLNLKYITIDDLATMVAKGFEQTATKQDLRVLSKGFQGLQKEMQALKEEMQALKSILLTVI